MLKGECPRCGRTAVLIKHHRSYVPEVIDSICRKCDSELRRKNPKNRGFKIIKTQPPRGLTFFPKDLLIHFGETIEIETAPITPVGIFFQYGLSVDEVVHALNLIIDSVKLQEAHNKIIPKE